MNKPIERYLVDTHFLGLPLLEQGPMEMRAAVESHPFNPKETREISLGLARFVRQRQKEDHELTVQASQSLAGSDFRRPCWNGR